MTSMCVMGWGSNQSLYSPERFPMGQMPCIADQGELEKPSALRHSFLPVLRSKSHGLSRPIRPITAPAEV